MTKSPRLFLTIIACAGMMTAASVSYADVNEKMKESKYCESNPGDPVCMGPEIVENAHLNNGNDQRQGDGKPDKILHRQRLGQGSNLR